MKCKMLGVLPELHRKNHTPGVLITTGVRLLGWAGLKNKQTKNISDIFQNQSRL